MADRPLSSQSDLPLKGVTAVSTAALDELMDALPPYFGLAVPLKGEEDEFNAAEIRLSQAYLRLRASMRVGE